MNKEYLGDSVYVEFNGWAIVLTTENGEGASNTIVLEQETYEALTRYVERIPTSAPITSEDRQPELE